MSSMRGMFFIIKGQYSRDRRPYFTTTSGNTMSLGGFDPENTNTNSWYMLMNTETWSVQCANSDIDKVLEGLKRVIIKHKGKRERFVREEMKWGHIVHGGQLELHKKMYEYYGDYYDYEIEEVVESAYEELREESPVVKNKKRMIKIKTPTEDTTPKKEEVIIAPVLHKGMRLRKKVISL